MTKEQKFGLSQLRYVLLTLLALSWLAFIATMVDVRQRNNEAKAMVQLFAYVVEKAPSDPHAAQVLDAWKDQTRLIPSKYSRLALQATILFPSIAALFALAAAVLLSRHRRLVERREKAVSFDF